MTTAPATVRFFDHYVTDGTTKAKVHYSVDNRAPGRPQCVTIYAKDYSRKLGTLFGTAYKNATDSQSDYFDEGHVTLEVGHPLYAAARAAAELAAARWAAHVARRDQKRKADRLAKAEAVRALFAPVPRSACGPDCHAMMAHTAECLAGWAK